MNEVSHAFHGVELDIYNEIFDHSVSMFQQLLLSGDISIGLFLSVQDDFEKKYGPEADFMLEQAKKRARAFTG